MAAVSIHVNSFCIIKTYPEHFGINIGVSINIYTLNKTFKLCRKLVLRKIFTFQTFETTSTALYFVCLCLAMHPEFQDKLYKELIEIFPSPMEYCNHAGTNDSTFREPSSDNGKGKLFFPNIKIDQLERMTYMEMVINEAMRLFAPVPMVLRRASTEFQLRNGRIIPKGTQICVDIYNMQRRKDIWGPLADTFNPDKHFGACTKPHSFAYVPFTKGLRMCIGYRYALILMKIMLAKIFRNFRLYTNYNMQNLKIKGTISLKLTEYPLCYLQQRVN